MIWNIDPEIFRFGPLAVRWYSLAFVIGFFFGEKYVGKILMTKYKFSEQDVSKLLFYMLGGTFIGARLGHVLFYQPDYYFSNPLEIIQVWKGGLASHGGFFGVIASIFLYIRKYKNISFLALTDICSAPSLFVGSLIRIGNFMNSEIVGHPSNVPWAIIFKRNDLIPRHPSQIYESIGYFAVAVTAYILYRKFSEVWVSGRILGATLFLGFLFRIFIEPFKENQVSFENGLFMNMGQILSIPFVIIGLIMALNIGKKLKNKPQ